MSWFKTWNCDINTKELWRGQILFSQHCSSYIFLWNFKQNIQSVLQNPDFSPSLCVQYIISLLICPQVPLFFPVVFCITCFFMVFLSLYSDPVNTGIGFAISLTGIPAYYIFIYFNHRPKWLQRTLGNTSLSYWWVTWLSCKHEINKALFVNYLFNNGSDL